MSLSLSLLGAFQASLNGQPLTEFYSSKVRALLAYLAVEAGQQHPRPMLATLLWPEWDDRAALGNLRFSLSKLRQAIHDQDALPPFLLISRDTLQLNPAADVSLDVHRFRQELRDSEWESLAGAGTPHASGQPESVVRSALERLRTAMDLYRGPFLEGFSVGDSAAFEEWALVQREELEREARVALHGLSALYARLGDYAAAERTVRQLLDLDPWDELANRRLMAVLAQEGQRNAALAHYAAYQEELARELGCAPEEETQTLYAQVRDDTLPQPPVSPPWPQKATGGIEGGPPRFVAREQELLRLGSLLDRALTGLGGIALIAVEAGAGKTALLDEFARRADRAHGDLITLRGSCNAHAGAGDPYLPFREMFQMLAGDAEGKRAGGTLSLDEARRAWEALPAVGAALVEHGPDLIDSFVPGEALLRHAEGFSAPPGAARWQTRLREIVRRAREDTVLAAGPGLGAAAPQPDLFAQVTQVLRALSVKSPLLLMIDDLQWADGGTAALLFHLGRRLAGSRILLACAYRPEALQAPPLSPPLRQGGSQTSPLWPGTTEGNAIPVPSEWAAQGGYAQHPVRPVLQELIREWGDVLVDLDRADGRAFVEAYVDGEPNRLGTAFRQALYDHTEGNPLFTVELLRSLQRDGTLARDEAGQWVETAGPNWERWPPQVEAVIAGHMAGLPDEERMLLQAASVQGEQFAAEVAARVLGWDEEAAVRRLSGPLRTRHRLVEAVSLERLAPGGQRVSRYRFRHTLVKGGAYRSLDAVERARLHEATGRALEVIYAPTGYGVAGGPTARGQALALAPELALAPVLAHHYEAAGMPLEAARHCLAAGRWAARLTAYDQAIAHLERGLALLEGAAPSRERLHLELGLCLALVHPALMRWGRQTPARTRAVKHLSDLTQHSDLQDDPQRLPALTVLAASTAWSADPERAQRVGEQLLSLAASEASRQAQGGDRQICMLAHWSLGHSQFLRGRLAAAHEHLGRAVALYEPDADRPLSLQFSWEPGAIGRAVLGLVLWLQGCPDQARNELRKALAQAEAIKQPSSVPFVHFTAGMAHLLLGHDVAAAQSHAAALRFTGETSLVYGAWARLIAGQVQDEQAGVGGPALGLQQGLARAAEAESTLQAMGSGVGHGALLLVQAQLCLRAGQVEAGLQAVDRATAWIEQTGMRVLEAEVWRTRGELLLARPLTPGPSPGRRGEEAEACFHRALEMAREQGARWLELRTVVSLARLWQGQGRRDEAHALLAEVYGWFTEGFDTVDLAEAKALLEELE